MKTVIKLGIVICLIIITSCSTTKNGINTLRDGSSFEKAVIVRSISEEYEYVGKVCPDCKLSVQYLTFKKKKPYDILEMERPDGEHVSYYFDISKFYGKRY